MKAMEMPKEIIAAIDEAVQAANGKRRERTCSLQQAIRIVARVAAGDDGAGIRATFGTVANSYRYRAPATQVTAVRMGDTVRVRIASGNAAKVAYGGDDYVESVRNKDIDALKASADGAIVVPIGWVPPSTETLKDRGAWP